MDIKSIKKLITIIMMRLNLKSIMYFSLSCLLISFSIEGLYGNVLNTHYLFLFISLLVLIANLLSRVEKMVKFTKMLHLVTILLFAASLLIIAMDFPKYTIGQAAKIVKNDITNKLNVIIDEEEQYKQRKEHGGNLIVNKDYKIYLKSSDMEYVYIFDPLTGNYSRIK